jgi:mono/diheme cytochrome c family protein
MFRAIIIASLAAATLSGQVRTEAQISKTTLDGVYSAAQAARGLDVYRTTCSGCHKADLSGINGPPLIGSQFMERWREFDLDVLFSLIRNNMPPDRSGSNERQLSENAYLDVLTYILQQNSAPSGTGELTAAMLENTLLVGKDGPKPVPSGALVQVVGCLDEGADKVWLLASASEPLRTKTPEQTSPAELKASEVKPLGTLTFRLQNLDYADPNFRPESFRGGKMQVKGYLIRQPSRERINITSIEMVARSCTR